MSLGQGHMFPIHRILQATRPVTKKVINVRCYPKVITYIWTATSPFQPKIPRLSSLQELRRSAPSSHRTWEVMERARVRVFMDRQASYPETDLLYKAQESDGSMSSDTEPDTLTAKQINDEVSK